MLPDELVQIQLNRYEPGHEDGSEHDRNGAFHWWLNKEPTMEQLVILVKLSYLDPDQLMAADVRSHIKKAKNFGPEVEVELGAT